VDLFEYLIAGIPVSTTTAARQLVVGACHVFVTVLEAHFGQDVQ
jgi:hypothetical protein